MDEHINDLVAQSGCNDLPDPDDPGIIERDLMDIVKEHVETEMLLQQKSGFYVWWERSNGSKGITDEPFKDYQAAVFYTDILKTLYGIQGFIVECA